MAKKKPQNKPQKEQQFHTTPFKHLKGVAVVPAQPAPSPPPPPVAKAPETEDEANLFLQAMGGVKRLDGKAQVSAPPVQAKKPVRKTTAPPRQEMVDRADQEAFAQALGQIKLDVVFADKFPEDDELKPLGENRLRQLKKGIIRVDRQLDLHGLTREEALDALPSFLRNARLHGEKAVLIITGKGYNSPGEPVLQQAVAAWMREAGKELVLEFASAPREMGGGGAFVVFLRG
jgi:DNA-nicking Smr family endonuclease